MARPWTEDELQKLTHLAEVRKLTPSQIASILLKTRFAVLAKLQRHGIAGYTKPKHRSEYRRRRTQPKSEPGQETKPELNTPSVPRQFSWQKVA